MVGSPRNSIETGLGSRAEGGPPRETALLDRSWSRGARDRLCVGASARNLRQGRPLGPVPPRLGVAAPGSRWRAGSRGQPPHAQLRRTGPHRRERLLQSLHRRRRRGRGNDQGVASGGHEDGVHPGGRRPGAGVPVGAAERVPDGNRRRRARPPLREPRAAAQVHAHALSSVPGPMHEVTVVGAGVVGLTTEIALGEAGHRVRVVSADRPERTTSAAAGAVWYPFSVGPPDKVYRWARTAREWLLRLQRTEPAAGV